MKRRHLSALGVILLVAATAVVVWQRTSLSHRLPAAARDTGRPPRIHPDYSGCCLPPNIAPLNFMIDEPGTAYRVHVHTPDQPGFVVASGDGRVVMPGDEWHGLLAQNPGAALCLDVYVRGTHGAWEHFETIRNTIAQEEIDAYVGYRRLKPIQTLSANMGTYQRALASFRQSPILESKEGTSQRCVNCHTYANNNPDTMLLHLRGAEGMAMLISAGGQLTKVSALSQYRPWPASYAAWHPGGRLLAVSFNTMVQFFHATGHCRDVFIFNSDLGVYDAQSQRVLGTPAISDPTRLETFPCWSPDGKYLYFASAPKRWAEDGGAIPPVYNEVKFDLMRIAFDPATQAWGELETVLAASQTGLSIVEPRVSPDGRLVLVAMCDYGSFPVFRESSDLYFVETATGKYWPLTTVNSSQSDSWHGWSSNGRWIVFASKRDSGVFGRLYFAHVDAAGEVAKPFVLPQADPGFYDTNLDNFNAPEFAIKAVSVQQREFLRAIYSGEAQTMVYEATTPPEAAPAAPAAGGHVRME